MTFQTLKTSLYNGHAAVIDRIVLWTGVVLVTVSVLLTLTPPTDTVLNETGQEIEQATAIRPV